MRFSLLPALAFSLSPSVIHSWDLNPTFYSLSTTPMLRSPSSLLAEHTAMADRMIEQTNQMLRGSLQYSSPRYDLVDDDTKFQLSIDVPGVKMEDIDITLEDHGYLTIRGQRVASNDNSKFMSRFSQTFSLDASVDVDKISASLDHGVLVVTAPKDVKKLEESVRKIPIMLRSSSSSSSSSSTSNVVSEASTVTKSVPVSDVKLIDSDEEEEEVDDMQENFELKNQEMKGNLELMEELR